MTYKQIKRLILILPTITIGVWEYVRHQFLLPYISMEAGNWLTPVDDGKGIEGNPFILENRYGLKIMKDRVTEMGWSLKLERERNQTVLTILEEAADR